MKLEALECVLIMHTIATSEDLARCLGGSGLRVHVVNVSCAYTLRVILAGNGRGVFEPDEKCRHLPNANAQLPGLCIDLLITPITEPPAPSTWNLQELTMPSFTGTTARGVLL
jgi:hypothetical protein